MKIFATFILLIFRSGIINAQLDTSVNAQLKKYQWYYCETKNLNLKDDNQFIKFLNTKSNNPCQYGYYYRFETDGNFKFSYHHKPTADSIRIRMLDVNARWKCVGDTITLEDLYNNKFYYRYKIVSLNNDSLVLKKLKSPGRKVPKGYITFFLSENWATLIPKTWKLLPAKHVAVSPSEISDGVDTVFYSMGYTNLNTKTFDYYDCPTLKIEYGSNLRLDPNDTFYEDTATIRKNMEIKKYNEKLKNDYPYCFNSIRKMIVVAGEKGVLIEPTVPGKGLTGFYCYATPFGISIWGRNLSEENSKELIKMIKALERKY